MKLKSLEISGFKSFADDTKIEFEDGVTGIVGPNGSGKSNVSEAIRWVLGEQSAKNLRGQRMPDVIFAGSADRKPLNRAMVTMVLDNSDHYLKSTYTELSVTRKLFRNGDSVYQLNGQDCRLKDILALFMDSGIGDGSFSMISQGRVEAIFNSKPEDRRFIVEELIGVSKYRQGKEKAQRELEQTAGYLDRVNDLMTELGGQIEPLAQQSSLAKEYLEQKKTYDQLEQSRLVLTIEATQTKLRAEQAQRTEQEARVKATTEHVDQTTTALTAAKKAVTQLQKTKDTLTQQLMTVNEKRERTAGERALSSERQRSHTQSLTELKTRIKETSTALTTAQTKLTALTEQLTTQQAALKTAREAATKLKTQLDALDADRLAAKQEQLQAEYIEQLQARTTLHNQRQYLEKNQQRANSENHQARERLTALKTQLADQQKQLTDAQQALQQAETELTDKQAVCDEDNAIRQKRATQLDQQNQQWLAALEVSESAKARLKSMQEFANNYGGFYQGTKAVMQAKAKLPGIIGPVATLLQVPADYTKAIEVAIGAQQQHVVVADEAAGKTAIKYLTSQRLGRSTFLPLTTIRTSQVTSSILATCQQAPGFLGVGADLVTVAEPKFNVVKAHLLGNVLIVDDLTHATQLAQLIHHRYRIITLAGEVVSTSGTMTGGRDKRDRAGVLSQQQDLKRLAATVQQMTAQLAEKQTALQTLKQAQMDAQADEQAHQSARQQALTVQQRAAGQVKLLQERVTTVTEQIQVQQAQWGLQDDDVDDFETALRQNEQQTTLTEQKITTLETQMAAAKDQQQNQSQTTQAVSDQYQDQRAIIERHSVEVKQSRKDQQATKETIATLTAQLAAFDDKVVALTQRQTDVGQEASTHQATLAELTKQQKQLESQLATNDTALTAAQDKQTELERTNQAARQTLASEERNVQQLTFNCSELSRQLDDLQSTLTEEYHVSVAIAKRQILALPLETIQQKLKLVKRGLADIGTVNVASIEEYDRVKERYDFLSQQQADLSASKENLLTTMNEMDQQVSERFKVTFDELNEQFQTTFKRMFGGGKAQLVLTTPDQLLTTGIEIMAEPPGKRLQSMRLLSGGERALTAITLLFAVLQVQPAPFCVLDEAEAALDPANTARFASYLSQFEDDTQFIVITHRKETMVQTDRLYGITMQESGVSKLVSVDLNQTVSQN